MTKEKIILEKMRAMISNPELVVASPVGKWLKAKIYSIDSGSIRAKVVIRKEMTNPVGKLHGGVIALIADEAIGGAVLSTGVDMFYVTVNLSIDYLQGADLGDELTIHGKVIRKGTKIINGECYIYNNENVIIAKATSNLVATRHSHNLF